MCGTFQIKVGKTKGESWNIHDVGACGNQKACQKPKGSIELSLRTAHKQPPRHISFTSVPPLGFKQILNNKDDSFFPSLFGLQIKMGREPLQALFRKRENSI